MSLLLAMFEGLADPDKNCSRAATVMINSLLKERGAVLQEKVKLLQEKVKLQPLASLLPPWHKRSSRRVLLLLPLLPTCIF